MTKKKKEQNRYHAGIDIGSTTAKIAVCDNDGKMIFTRYRRHQTETVRTVSDILKEALHELGDVPIELTVTGSAGMGAAEIFSVPFVQEVVASASFIKKAYPDVRTFIEVGGEDSKIIFFDDHFRPDIRMNGSCAGGTGAFIDQMAVLLNVPVNEFNNLASNASRIYSIASRCGVFAKTDVQALMSRGVSRENIAASVFHSVSIQVISSLARGREIKSKVLFGGGPLTFYPELRTSFIKNLGMNDLKDVIIPQYSELIPAIGAAFSKDDKPYIVNIKDLISLPDTNSPKRKNKTEQLSPLFQNRTAFEAWEDAHSSRSVEHACLSKTDMKSLFLGIDSGSTTTKLVVIDNGKRLVSGHYEPNNGNPIKAVENGLQALKVSFEKAGIMPEIVRSATTGYGEDLIKAAFGLDDGVVETMAHYRAAITFAPDVSFILDIGGQDMKAIYISNGVVSDIQVNEACSSGCGSFIETFARSLGYDVSEFAELACNAKEPFDLGTRCTVFMNSKVKQALREGAGISDISAGLAYSVIKNALFKVLKLRKKEILGDKIVVQGGTFRNPAVLRAFELLLQKDVIRPDIPELMGAYGAAITALNNHLHEPEQHSLFNPFREPATGVDFKSKNIKCHGCENNCRVVMLTFSNGNRFYTGNRCERHFTNASGTKKRGRNLVAEKLQLLFDRPQKTSHSPILTYGIPRCLNMYENYPFWATFLEECGFKVILSSPSSMKLFEKAASTVMSDNICFPAKLSHSHIYDLAEQKVNRIFYPIVVYEQDEFPDAVNSFNCPVVTGYPDVLKSSMDPYKKYGISIDSPAVSFQDISLLKRQLHLFFKKFGLNLKAISYAVEKGLATHRNLKKTLINRADKLIKEAKKEARMVVVLAGRPYHIDPLINHGISDFLVDMGVDVITEDAIPYEHGNSLSGINVLTQWIYTNRLYAAAKWVQKEDNTQLIQLTSFGCGPDAVSCDEVRDILREKGKIYTLIKMDEISNLGAVRIRLRSMLEAVKERRETAGRIQNICRKPYRVFTDKDRKRTLIAPYFSPFYSMLIPAAFRPLGYKVDVLPPQDSESIELGLKNINNDICYPAVLIAGDIIKAFKSGKYDPENTSVILTQTGGQCRASCYVSLIQKALSAASLADVPVVAISFEDINPQPGFIIDKKELVKRMGLGVIFTDPLSRMYLSSLAREKEKGGSKALHEKYLKKMEWGIETSDYGYLLEVLGEAVDDFNSISVTDRPVPVIGVVGEIFVKYNFFANGNIIEWLAGEGVEVVLPTLQGFFTQSFINENFDRKAFFKHSFIQSLKTRLTEIYLNFHLSQIDRIMQNFCFYRRPFNLKKLAEITEEVVSLANQYGEGWLLTADMIGMLENGINNIVCLQPFGCISNHITGKGLERKLKEMYPSFNLLALDMDAGASEINIINRLQFMAMAAKEDREQVEAAIYHPVAWPSSLLRIYGREIPSFGNHIVPEIEKWKTWVYGLDLWKKANDFIRK